MSLFRCRCNSERYQSFWPSHSKGFICNMGQTVRENIPQFGESLIFAIKFKLINAFIYLFCIPIKFFKIQITWKDLRADHLVKSWNDSWTIKCLRLGSGLLHLVTRNKRFLKAPSLQAKKGKGRFQQM
jgi:hypothetical protein